MTDSNIEEFRLSPGVQATHRSGTLRERLAGPSPDAVTGRSNYLRHADEFLPPEANSLDLGAGLSVHRNDSGGVSLRSGNLRRVLAEADTDALIRLRAAKAAQRG